MPARTWLSVVLLTAAAAAAAAASVAVRALDVADEAPRVALRFADDAREEIRLTSFGFRAGGHWNVTLRGLVVRDLHNDYPQTGGGVAANNLTGLVFRSATTRSAADGALEACTKTAAELLDSDALVFFPLPDGTPLWNNVTRFTAATAALWSIVMINCRSNTLLTFDFEYQMENPGPRYLSAGDEPLPLVLGLYAALFLGVSCVWLGMLVYSRDRRVLWPHWVMLALYLIKSISLVMDSMKYYYVMMGANPNGWTISYYVFLFLKGGLHFSILFLIATGWVFVKPYLSDRDKVGLAVVLVLQGVSNTAYVVYSEMSDTSSAWTFWRFSFIVVDLACCFIVVLPIMQTKLHIAQSDPEGKRDALKAKYNLWGRLYIIIFSYVYITRIVVELMRVVLYYDVAWLAEFFEEMSTAAFYVYLCYAFRPVIDNPYFEVAMDDEDFEEIPLETFGRLRHRDGGMRRAQNGGTME